jgi:hypothetical protein
VAKVLWRDAQGREGSVELGAGPCGIGRAVECAIRSDDAMVSRNHARIVRAGDGWLIEDLGSSNGTYYQERQVSRHQLRHGDAVRCGSLWLRFIDQPHGAPGAHAAPPPVNAAGIRPIDAAMGDPTTGMQPVLKEESGAVPAAGGASSDEVAFLRRRVEQLKAELRLARGGGAKAKKFEDAQEELVRLTEERDQLLERVGDLEAQIASEGGDVKVQRAGKIAETAGEVVIGLNDVLSNLRINVMAAEGEFEQFHDSIPRASYELIREALRSSADDMQTARELLRRLRELAGVS